MSRWNSANQSAARLLLQHPVAIAIEVPVAARHQHAPPGFLFGLRHPRRVANHDRVGPKRGVSGEVGLAVLAQDQTRGFENGNCHWHAAQYASGHSRRIVAEIHLP